MTKSDLVGRLSHPRAWLRQANRSLRWWSRDPATSLDLDPLTLLDRHSQHLRKKGRSPDPDEQALLDEMPELLDLMKIAENAARCIHATQPSPQFRQQLKVALLAAHQQKAARRVILPTDPSSIWSWQMMATVPVLLGIAALLWRYTHRSAESTNAA